jgi:asparagine synthetase B (glutamine-hydrolysing)
MCGIMGYYSFGNTLPDKDKITNMFSLLESRGRDASGFAFIKITI